ncbi:MAG: tRNA-specific adenosine deaminase, partial [Clostridia bacterium]|nr:tRNA-specific adenosine deaminase [Clostridia bacterium]
MKQRFMKMAINQAIAALSKGEVPIGAVIVKDNKVIA